MNLVNETAGKIPVIETEACLGCGVCVDFCPEVFSLMESIGKAVVINPGGCSESRVEAAIEACPVHCIGLE
jgi:ferredoxin